MRIDISLLSLATLAQTASGLATVANTREIVFPLKTNQHKDLQLRNVKYAFQELVESTDFFVQNSPAQFYDSTCLVPALGAEAAFQFQQSTPSDLFPHWSTELVLKVNTNANSDFGWICAKVFEQKELFEDFVDTTNLYEAVVDHYNSLGPHPGFPASSAELSNSPKLNDLFREQDFCMEQLRDTGFVVLDNAPKTSVAGHRLLDQFLHHKTNQDTNVRTDSVHFLSRKEAQSCGFEEHYDTLMGIASYLNGNLEMKTSPHDPMNPATQEHPLTIPNSIQLAEYAESDFYKAHSDNSLTNKMVSDVQNNDRVRANFRHYTCILYCNDDWEEQDGGALRLYPHTRNLSNANDAILNGYDFFDVSPKNGRLVIFDSSNIHSVEKVTHTTKKRRALTLWITRPNNSGVEGEQYF
ncbi:unnamed protein product [Cylindrotheca closterium]|uniref:Fe2OG dioxygenase domain-containing protein n=1 Tax=Cylindrotheca closterium TaxID=2856 RepID=A0AAD2FVL4_9STRA|nr:unnamed protein product [Cylindrotheca closterium]